MSENGEYNLESPMYLKRTKMEIEEEVDATTEWYELLCEEWDQLLHNGTFSWLEAAQFLGYKIEDISTNNELDNTKLIDFFIARAHELALLEGPDKRYVLDYEPFPKGESIEKEELQGNDEHDKKDFAYRTVYLKELLTHLGFAYSLASIDRETADSHKHLEDHLESRIVWQFYIYNLKKAVFVSNQPGHATIIVHNVFEEEVKPIAKNITRIEVQDVEWQPFISRVFWIRAETLEQEKNIWQERMKLELSRITSEEKQSEHIRDHAHTKEIDDGDMDKAELVRLVEKGEHPPEGWMTVGEKDRPRSISYLLKRNKDWVKLRIKDLVAEHPEWEHKLYLGRNNELAFHYPPELIAELVRLTEQEEYSPEGWMIVGDKKFTESIVSFIQRDRDWVTVRIMQLIKEHPEWESKLYLGKRNKLCPHYPPGLIDFLYKLKTKEDEYLKNGWLFIGQYTGTLSSGISEKCRKSRTWVKKYLDLFLSGRPDMVEAIQEVNKYNSQSVLYPPEAVNHLESIARNN